jgi:hypothetical protein
MVFLQPGQWKGVRVHLARTNRDAEPILAGRMGQL